MERLLTCVICGQQFDSAESPALPFCSYRCQQIDLGRWFNEAYRVTVDRPESDDSSESE
jgi:hypothetical protein